MSAYTEAEGTDPGADESAITDAMILVAVEDILSTETPPSDAPPEDASPDPNTDPSPAE
ncbi:hypothetical protein JD276_04390 [Leucobacter sp. CSA1]|uniref:Uncharacterized protein n=1 Tax=Leucobacter chromiisoli TaxID=2796471 RepID=A0A934Q7U8_9MICO|nr:hypothetical protein [Leucobacter chromiisoli]MBK0418269.1 hypothetical protein [Leucobacter chromiisoli]